ncbi:MAG: ABC transporter ATP-binding protein [Bacteroidota bacterium]
MNPLLQVQNLGVTYHSPHGEVNLLEKVSFSVEPEEIFALVGESGSGKTTLACALTRLFPTATNLKITGRVLFDDIEISDLGEQELQRVRKERIRYVFQEPSRSLNPVAPIRRQLLLASVRRQKTSRDNEMIDASLKQVGIEQPEEILRAYPHQLSVGTLQRITIAMALLSSPKLLIADEPTTAVDAPLRHQILELLNSLRRTLGVSILLITHDLEAVRQHADRIAVLYAGRLVELAPREAFLRNPLHPYSQMLLKCSVLSASSLDTIPSVLGSAPSPISLPSGCKFHPRCFKVQKGCSVEEPDLALVGSERLLRCPYWK